MKNEKKNFIRKKTLFKGNEKKKKKIKTHMKKINNFNETKKKW
jgi:hypothetical protein